MGSRVRWMVSGLSSGESVSVAFVLSLVGGLLILLGGVVSVFWLSWMWSGMMGHMMMGWPGMGLGFPLIGLVSGLMVLIGAFMLSSRPRERAAWGTLIIVFSVTGLLGGGGLLIGSILGIIGGALALTQEAK